MNNWKPSVALEKAADGEIKIKQAGNCGRCHSSNVRGQRWRADDGKGTMSPIDEARTHSGRYEGMHSTQPRGASLFVVVARNEVRSSEFVNVPGKDNRHESSQKLRCLVIK